MKKTLLLLLLVLALCVVPLSACHAGLDVGGGQSVEQPSEKHSEPTEQSQPTEQTSEPTTEPTTEETENTSAPTESTAAPTEPTVAPTEPAACSHTFGDWVITKPANCKEAGERARTCGKCAATEKEIVAKNDTHTPVTDAAVPATCKTTGLTEGSHCSVCNKVLVAQTTVPVTDDHIPVTDAAVPATCKTTGLTEGSHCSVCNLVFVAQNPTPQTEHNYIDNLCACGTYKDSEGLTLAKSGSGYTVTGIGSCQDARIVVPATYNGLPVKSISADAFKSVNSFYEIILPSSVTSIGPRAFAYCKGLKTIAIPNGVKYLEIETFVECTALERVQLSSELLQIMERCFVSCTSLKQIEIPKNVIKIREYAFLNCKELEEIVLPTSLNEIQQFAFYDCVSLSIQYSGMRWQFKELSKGFEWCGNVWSSVITCKDGDCDFDGNAVNW